MSLLYRSLLRVLRRLGGLFARPGSKLGRGLEGRREAHRALVDWGRERRDSGRPVVWFHAPSVGEGLQARAVIDELIALRPEVQIVYTYFSPSAETLGQRMPAEVATYLPWDLPREISDVLDAVCPELVVFAKTEVWPVLTEEAVARGIPTAIIGASVPDGAGRARWPARALLHDTWASLSVACAITDEDGARLAELGVRGEAVHVTGDPGIDSAAERARAGAADAPYLSPFTESPRPTVVAGSTWPSGEDVLVPALSDLKGELPELRVVFAPHEPTDEHVSALMARLHGDSWRVARLSDVEAAGSLGEHDAIVVDSVGRLAHLYTIGDVAYVGGGFHDQGLHSVLEPAAAGIPSVFGPKHTNARAATDLLEVGGAKVASSSEEIERCLSAWLSDAESRERAGKQAFRYIDRHLGAAERTARLLVPLLEKRLQA